MSVQFNQKSDISGFPIRTFQGRSLPISTVGQGRAKTLGTGYEVDSGII